MTNYSRFLKKVKNALFWMFCGFCFGITPYIFHIADLERGYNATGGEIFIPLIPVLIILLSYSNKNQREERKQPNV